MKIAIGQINTITGNIIYNAAKIKENAAKAKAKGADLVVFPELSLPGGFAKDLYLRKDFEAECSKKLKILSQNLDIPTVFGTFYDNENAAVYIKNKNYTHIASKINSFEDLRYFKNNDLQQLTDNFSCCIFSDTKELERSAKKAAEMKAECLIVLANEVFYIGRIEEVSEAVCKCASENKVNIVFVNTAGAQDGLVSYGGSFAVSKKGKHISSCSLFKEDMIIVDMSSDSCVELEKPSDEKQAYDALVLGLKDYAVKNGFNKFVIGISGGVDSALVAVIAKDAFGAENITGIFMPSEFTAEQSKKDSELLCEMNGIKLLEVPINGLFDAFKKSLSGIFQGTKEDLTEENIQSRIRNIILMAYSNKFNAMLLNTENKSEAAVGYSTLYGDLAGGYAVVSDIPKTFLYKVCEYRNSVSKSIPESIIKREPTAELRHDQKDSDSLPKYEILDDILSKYLRSFESSEPESFSQDEIKIFNMINKAEYKRQQCPLGTKIFKKSFGREIRIPLTNGYRQ